MAFVIKDRVKETTTTTGTGTVTLLGAVSGFEAFSAIGNTNTTYYAIVHQSADEWEVGIGTYTASGTTLARTTVLSSTNSDAAVDFAAGTKDVFVTYPADKAVYVSASPAFINVSVGGALTGVSAAFTNHVSVNSLAVVGATSIGGALSGVSATFSNHVSANTLAVVGITSIGGSLVGTSATFGDHVSVSSFAATGHVSASTFAATGIVSVGGSLVGTSATFGDHVSVSSMAVTGNVTAANFYGGGANLTGVQATSAALATNVSGGYAVLTSAQIRGDVSVGGVLFVNATAGIGVGVAAPLAQVHIAQNAIADIVSLTDAASVSISFQNGQNFSLTLGGNRALSNPTQCVPGQVGSIFMVQDGTGSRTLSYGTNWEFPAASAPTLSTSAAAVDRLDYIVRTSTAVQAILSKEYG
jgi:hypothetical protein